jgi:ABC-2 type transport system permease protein
MLELVDLDAAAARKRVAQYSLGMRQRLGIANALLGDPEVLILDEPANGLDPEGMRWMRGLLHEFASRGGTVLLSSHLLRKVEAIADHFVIIASGRIVAQGTPKNSSADTPGPASAPLTTTCSAAHCATTYGHDARGGQPMSALVPAVYHIPASERRAGFARLTRIELRKTLDTRSGLWFSAAVAAITLIAVLITSQVKGGHDATLPRLFNNSVEPAAILLPVLGVLLVCGEWSQRTTLTTFTLVPHRGRILQAKLAAAIVVAGAAFAVCLACSMVVGELLPAPGGTGSLSIVVLAQGLVFLAATMVIGVAFGAAIMLSAPAIVIYLALPTACDALSSTIHPLKTLSHWLAIGPTLGPLATHFFGVSDWAHAGTTLALWLRRPPHHRSVAVARRDVN